MARVSFSEGTEGMDPTRVRQLHQEGVVELPEGAPRWAPLEFCEDRHAAMRDECFTVLESLRPWWWHFGGDANKSGDDDGDLALFGGRRVGAWAARIATRRLARHRVLVSATHPSVDDATWEVRRGGIRALQRRRTQPEPPLLGT